MALQGVSEIIKRVAALEHLIDADFKYEAAAMNDPRQHGSLMFVGMIVFMLIGYPPPFRWRRPGCSSASRYRVRLIRPDFLGSLTYQLFGIISNDLLLASRSSPSWARSWALRA
jgi:hypothetical protein